ncbi:MAG: helix-turn-helix transcriptional regulator, partial [Hominilimicola sp.]
QSGIPIYTTKGKNGGISILDNFVLDKSLISDKEQSEIITALAAMSALPNIEKTGIESKLSLLFHKNNASWINVDFSEWGASQQNVFDKLKKAIIEKRVTELEYINSRGLLSKRSVEPLQMWFKSRTWYLIAYCHKAENYRIFRLSRMKEINVTEQVFERDLDSFEYAGDNASVLTAEVTLRISPEMEYRIYDEFQDIEKDDDGYFIVKMNYHEDEWLYGYIMSFGEYVRVIEPLRIRNIIKEKMQNSLKNYL